MEKLFFKHCPYCATPLELTPRGGRLRPWCPSCGFVQYLNPTAGVAVVVMEGDKILLGKRAEEVSYGGMWCIPCGHLEWDEDVREAAIREFKEETGLEVKITGIVAVHSNFHNPRQHTVGIWFWGEVVGGQLEPGDDLVEVGFFPLDTPPGPLAFPTDRLVIEELKKLKI
ncbi:MAG TPA: NUDIX hydrolase [Thermosulfidibacter takaii]|uniref:NUDIX hydrolase n=1 Tax=Thermosulfidibacter takaii TaxID=412593 RepID=A0A7C0YAV0_9BACT|nr:NUDIX hydrolase [Thermosulfidibacter takaii]